MISKNSSRYTINVTTPFNTSLVYSQQFFFPSTIVSFRRSVLTTMVSQRMQTVVVLLEQYSAGCITTCISINDERFIEVWQPQNWGAAQKVTKLLESMVLVTAPTPGTLRTG